MSRWKDFSLIPILCAFCCAIRGSIVGDEQWEKAMNRALLADPRIPPSIDQGKPTTVTVNIHISSLDCINEFEMEFCVTFFLNQRWNDHRTRYDKLPSVDRLELDFKSLPSVWIPDLYFVNEKRAYFHDMTVPNALMYIYPNGTVLYTMRLSMNLACFMELQTFPFDTQYCFIRLESFGYNIRLLVFEWDKVPITTASVLYHPQFNFSVKNHKNCVTSYIGSAGGLFSCLTSEFVLVRNYGFYITQVFVPTVLIVILSWVSFWLDIDSVPGRVSLGILTVLTMATHSSSAGENLPHVSYIKAIDIWMATCMFFVFAALIEFAYVNVNARVPPRLCSNFELPLQTGCEVAVSVEDLSTTKTRSSGQTPSVVEQGGRNNDEDVGEKKSRSMSSMAAIGRRRARRLDRLSRGIFPLVFLVFNICYWSFYLTWQPNSKDD